MPEILQDPNGYPYLPYRKSWYTIPMNFNQDDPVRLTTKAQNNRLKSIRESEGLSAKAFSAKLGISYGSYLDCESLRRYPSEALAMRIAEALGLSADYIFPSYIRGISKTVSVSSIPEAAMLQLEDREVRQLIAPDFTKEHDRNEFRDQLNSVLADVLSPREQGIIGMRFGLDGGVQHTLEEVGIHYGIGRERVRQIELRAMQRLRHPTKRPRLLEIKGLLVVAE